MRGQIHDLKQAILWRADAPEGEKDDICAVGQTLAAQELCMSIRPYRKRHHMQPGAGHYSVFSGRKWETQIYLLLKNVILASD